MSAPVILWIGLGVVIIGMVIAAIEVTLGVLRSMRREERRTQVFCPGCKIELISNGAYVGETDRGLSVFECRGCKVESYWDFYAPAPILIKPAPREEIASGH